MANALPKVLFRNCDETSLSLDLGDFTWNPGQENLKLQYKEPPEPWTSARSIKVSDISTVHEIDVVDLKPGTPYFVRLCLERDDDILIGPESVFDTMPVDCTPKRKKCAIM